MPFGPIRSTMMNFPLTLSHIFERARRLFPKIEVVALRADGCVIRSTYGEVCAIAIRLAQGLRRAGLRRGDRVATLMWNHAAHLEAYLGIPEAGGVLHPLNLRLHPEELSYIVNHAGDRFLLVDLELLPVYEAIRKHVSLERVFVRGLEAAPPSENCESLASLLEYSTGEPMVPPIEPLDENEAPRCITHRVQPAVPKGWFIPTALSSSTVSA
jgi:fatty-acyl-CoA synthase